MAIEQTEAGTVITGEHIQIYRLLALRTALRIEVRTGLRMSKGSILAMLQHEGITNKRTKRGAFEDLNALIFRLGGTRMELDTAPRKGGAHVASPSQG